MPPLTRVVPAALLVLYVGFLLAVLTQYTPTVAIDVVTRSEGWLEGHGAPGALTGPGRVEFVLNAAMFTPVVLLAALVVPRHPWANWVVYGFVASCGVELAQGLLLPPRSAEFADVVANTLGALVGAVAALPLTRRASRRRGDEPSR